MTDRAFFKLKVKAGHEQEYVDRHKNVWPQVKADLQAAGVKEMSIWMDGRDIFLMMVCADYKAATKFLDGSPTSVKWEEYMEEIMQAGDGGEYDPNNAYPGGLPEVFRWLASVAKA
eukprot:SAG31_NODE_2626_length_5353_cov_5.529692_2_plen_116_part_00